MKSDAGRKPPWLRVRLGGGANYKELEGIISRSGLHTVCDEALCPNKGRCWENRHATFLILGDKCTRGCSFCNVTPERPAACDIHEPRRVAEAVANMHLKEIVITSVTRDDLADGGAAIWAETIRLVKEAVPYGTIEVLTPDFRGSAGSLELVIDERPDVFGHNLETVPSLYPEIRTGSSYARSLEVLAKAAGSGLVAKTSIMLGLGESDDEIRSVMRDALSAGCDIFFIGQYLRPSRRHVPVRRYAAPEEFEDLKRAGLSMGFKIVVAGPLVRSSYHSDEQSDFINARKTCSGR